MLGIDLACAVIDVVEVVVIAPSYRYNRVGGHCTHALHSATHLTYLCVGACVLVQKVRSSLTLLPSTLCLDRASPFPCRVSAAAAAIPRNLKLGVELEPPVERLYCCGLGTKIILERLFRSRMVAERRSRRSTVSEARHDPALDSRLPDHICNGYGRRSAAGSNTGWPIEVEWRRGRLAHLQV